MASVDQLAARRAEVFARHEILESVPGSGWHKDDAAFRGTGRPPLTARPIALQERGRVYFVGPDAAVVRAACERWAPPAADPGAEPNAIDAQATEAAADILGDAADPIKLTTQEFNAVLRVLAAAGLEVCLTGITA